MIKHTLNIKPAESHMGFFHESTFSLLHVLCVTVTTEATQSIWDTESHSANRSPQAWSCPCCKSNFHCELQQPLRERQCFKNNQSGFERLRASVSIACTPVLLSLSSFLCPQPQGLTWNFFSFFFSKMNTRKNNIVI